MPWSRIGRLCVPLAALLVACADDVATPLDTDDGTSSTSTQGATDSGSTSGTASASTTENPTTSGDETTSTSTSTSSGAVDETGSTSTGEPQLEAHARFAVRTGEPGAYGLVFVEYDQGQVSAPLDMLTDVPAGFNMTSADLIDDERLLVACGRIELELERECGVLDLAQDPPGPFQNLVDGDVPDGVWMSLPTWSPATQTLWFAPEFLPEGGYPGIFSAQVEDGVVASPALVFQPAIDEELRSFTVGSDGQRIGYVLGLPDGSTHTHVRSAEPLDDASDVVISTPAPAGMRNGGPVLLPEHDAALYARSFDINTNPHIESLWFVDLSGDMPGAPVRVDDLAGTTDRISRYLVAPDRHALVYWSMGAEGGMNHRIVWVDLSTGTPQAPVEIYATSDETALLQSWAWSSDSRWVAYRAGPDFSDQGVHLVDASGQNPGLPIDLSEGLVEGGGVLHWIFDHDATALYFIGQVEQIEPRLFRVDISGDTPGTREPFGGPGGRPDDELILSHDGTALMHGVIGDKRQIAVTDVGARALEPWVVLNAPLDEDEDDNVRFGARFSADDTVVGYRQAALDGPNTLHFVEVAAPGEAVAVEGFDVAAIYPAPAPR